MVRSYKNLFLLILLISSIANTFYVFAFPILAFHQTKSIIDMGSIAAIEAVTALILFPFIGYITDKIDSKKLLVVTEFIQFIILIIFWLLLQNDIGYIFIYLVAIIITATSQLNRNVTFKIIPILFKNLKDGNSKITFINLIGDIFGPLLAAILIGIIGINSLILIDGLISFLVSIIYQIFINKAWLSQSTKHIGNFMDEAWKGMKFTLKNKTLLLMMTVSLLSALADNGLINLLIFAMKNNNNFSDEQVGFVFTLSAFSSIIASYLINKVKIKNKHLYFIGLLFNNLAVFLLLIDISWIIPIVLIITGFFGIIFLIVQNVIIQVITPKEILGRVNSFFRVSTYSVRPISILILSLIANSYGYHMSIIFSVVILIITSIVSLLLYRKIPMVE